MCRKFSIMHFIYYNNFYAVLIIVRVYTISQLFPVKFFVCFTPIALSTPQRCGLQAVAISIAAISMIQGHIGLTDMPIFVMIFVYLH